MLVKNLYPKRLSQSATDYLVFRVVLSLVSNCILELVQSASLTKEFYTLSTNIYKSLELSRNNRSENSLTYLESVYGEYSSLCANSYIVKKNIVDNMIPLPEYIPARSNSLSTVFNHSPVASLNQSQKSNFFV